MRGCPKGHDIDSIYKELDAAKGDGKVGSRLLEGMKVDLKEVFG